MPLARPDAWPLRSGGENEKLLFYRGIGYFGVDLKPVVYDDGVALVNGGVDPIASAVVFETYAGHMAYRVSRNLRDPETVDFLAGGYCGEPARAMEQELVEMGLYPKEARAMLETWGDSWFEERLRVFYILPRAKVDALLPISIQPAPEQLARVFVGRVELPSP